MKFFPILSALLLACMVSACDRGGGGDAQSKMAAPSPAAIPAKSEAEKLAEWQAEHRAEKAHEAQGLAMKIRATNADIDDGARQLAAFIAAGGTLADTKALREKLVALSITNMLDYDAFKGAFSAAGAAYKDQVPVASRCDSDSGWKVSNW